jgi:hypothetical protein
VKWDVINLIPQVRAVCEITPGGCWLWRYGSWAVADLEACTEYPRLMIGGQRHHVATWVLKVAAGDAPGMEPCHSCDRPACVAPAHLRWGTHKENMAEMAARKRTGSVRHPERYRGRVIPSPVRGADHWMRRNPEQVAQVVARGERHGSKTHPERWARGERQGCAKLTAAQIPGIRQRLEAGEQPAVIAPDYGVGRGTIRAIAEGRTWRHVA